jgi:hypothetical protein
MYGRDKHHKSGRGEGGGGDCAGVERSLEFKTSQSDSLHLTQCNLVLCPIVKFGCARRLMAGHLLGVLEPSVILQVNGLNLAKPEISAK